jgi:hypothetical protein
MARISGGFLDAAYLILKEAGHPMHGHEIVQACLQRGLWATNAEDPNISGTTTLYSEIRRHPNRRGFTMLGKGQFGLKEWADAEAGQPDADHVTAVNPALDQPVTAPVAGHQFTLTGRQLPSGTGCEAGEVETIGLTKQAFLERARAALAVVVSGLEYNVQTLIPDNRLLKVALAPFAGAYYELWLRPKGHEIGLGFESSQKLNRERMEAFLPHQEALSRSLGEPVRVGPWGSSWTRVWYELPAAPLSEDLAVAYATRLHRLIQVTMPILRQVYAMQATPVQLERRTEAPAGAHAVLDAQIAAVRDFLNGRASRPSDERLCDWVNFCYEFGLYREGRDLFRLIDPIQVNDWYYERAKRLARVCAMKMAGQA